MIWLGTVVFGVLLALVALTLLYRGRPFWAWIVPVALSLGGWWATSPSSHVLIASAATGFAMLAAVFGLRPLRRSWVSRPLMPVIRRFLPKLGETERVALEAGTVWWDGELFSGRPDWERLLRFERRGLTVNEQEFLDGPVDELCAMLDDWEVTKNGDLPVAAWDFIKRHRFLGMIIPEEHGGLGFTNAAHSAVVTKLASRSVAAAVTVMVPNSLGPAELLLRYGTTQQKAYYLPRLATGEELPCFALTGPEAGSDAAATQSVGVVCGGRWEGKEVLGMRLDWRKRYITLGPVATLIGLAFRLRDPDGHLGGEEDLGITCALIPSRLPGIEIGDRHDPLGVPFQNGPTEGHGVFVPLDYIIGGPQQAGRGWRMLMESLAAGRSISLPSLAVGAAKLSARVVSAYAMVREQFDTPIGRFEGVEDPLARIATLTYAMNAARRTTIAALDAGEQPAVLSAIVKAYLTEQMRTVVNHAMDIRAGAGIMRGPRNVLASAYMAVPIGITVEGANILTRSMIIFGQGAIRCHPYVLDEIRGLEEGDLARFDRALFGHLGLPLVNAVRALVLRLTGGRLFRSPRPGPLAPFFGRLSGLSAAFSLTSDVALITLGGALKRRERLTGRLADALAWLYISSTVLKEFHDDEQPPRDLPVARSALEHGEKEIERALLGVVDNLPNRVVAWLVRRVTFPFGAHQRSDSDQLATSVARMLIDDPQARQGLTRGIYLPKPDEVGLGRLEAALEKCREALEVEKKIKDAIRNGHLDRRPGMELADRALAAGVITSEERLRVDDAKGAAEVAIQVDTFSAKSFRTSRSSVPSDAERSDSE